MRLTKLFSLLLLIPSLAAVAADSITGVVTNGTHNGKPSAGDDVVLIRLAQGMQESTRTKTDAKGRFTLEVPDSGLHLVRVTHDKAAYFRPAPPGTQSVEVEVFDAAPKVKAVSLEASILRVQTDEPGKVLRITQNFFVKNDSKPPVTQFSERAFEFTLPDGAVVEGSAALAPGGMPVQAQPAPLSEKGHYAFIFPIRPGETRFQVTYHLPYTGSFTFPNAPIMDTDTLVVIMPKNMKFSPGGIDFNPVTDEVDAQTFVARKVTAGKPYGITVSGTGQLPRQTQTNGQAASGDDASQQPASGNGAQQQSSGADDANRPGGGLANPIGTPDPLTKYKWWIIGGLALLLAVGAGIMLRAPQPPATTAAAPVAGPVGPSQTVSAPATIQTVMRDELFSLEADRLSGRISEEEYNRLRPAFDLVLKRALDRQQNQNT